MVIDPFRLTGQVIDGQFRVDRIAGEGGFSVVYRGHHLGLDEPVAIKVLKLQPAVDPDVFRSFQDRFRDESRIAYRLSRGNLDIVRSITAGTTQAPTGILVPYMVLEWLDGRSLGSDFRERRAKGMTGRTIDDVMKLFDPAVTAIAFAHSQGVVHRDLKPGNLFLAETPQYGPRLKVLDFGLAKIIDPSEEGIGMMPSAQTVGQHTICSPSYGAPEQFDKKVGKIGPWTDVYALGLLLLEALRDKKVRTGDGIAMCAVEALDPNRQPSPHSLGIKLKPQIEVIIARAVALDPSTRPEDAGVFWGLLKNALRRVSGAPPARPPGPQEMATMVDTGPRSFGNDEPTRQAPHDMSELSSTAERDATVPRAAFRSEPPIPRANPDMSAQDELGGTLVMENAPPRPSHGASPTSPLAATGVPHAAGMLPPSSAPTTLRTRPRKKSRAGTVLLVIFLMLALFAGGGYAAYRFVLLPRGIALPFVR